MSTPDIKTPAASLPPEVSGVSLPPEAAARPAPKEGQAASTGISNLNVHTDEGRAQVEKVLVDLGLDMPEFLSGAESKLTQSMSEKDRLNLRQVSQATAKMLAEGGNAAASANLQGRWANFVGSQKLNGAVDVNALVQQVLREAYLENTKDLHFFAQKVRYYNDLKKNIRDELTKARKFMADNAAGLEPADGIPGYNMSKFSSTPVYNDNGELVPAPATSDGVAGTKEQLETYIKNLEEQLNSVGDDAQLANVDLQNMLQKQQQTLQMMSNISKMLHDTAMAIIRKIGS